MKPELFAWLPSPPWTVLPGSGDGVGVSEIADAGATHASVATRTTTLSRNVTRNRLSARGVSVHHPTWVKVVVAARSRAEIARAERCGQRAMRWTCTDEARA